MVWIKICGITNEEDALKISDLGADALGLIFSTKSARKIESGRAKEITSAVKDKFINKRFPPLRRPNKKEPSFVGVFVNEDIDRVIEITKKLGLDYVQLSGDETPDYLKKIKKHNKNIKLIKLIRVKDNVSSFAAISKQMLKFKKTADLFLLDTFKENIYGGTGKSFNWEIVKGLSKDFPVILAGGLDCENVAGAIQIVKPFGIDASTKLEESPGKKDIGKVEIFIKNAIKRQIT
ncbi:MAG: phosphoribosylanthranilate isomerase [Actinobacteria bacterium]|nr:phosphoribosylanthranilate isomerase [Actinomycetota bacterium]